MRFLIISSLGDLFVAGCLGAGLFYAGMRCQGNSIAMESARIPYEVVKTESGYSLFEKATSIEQPIQKYNFQLGSVDYRVKGLFEELPEERAWAIKLFEERLSKYR